MSTDLYRVLDKLRAAWSENRAEITGRILRGNESLSPIAYWLDRLAEAMAERPSLGVDVAALVHLLEDVRPAVRAQNKGYDGESGRDLVDEIDATLRSLKLRAALELGEQELVTLPTTVERDGVVWDAERLWVCSCPLCGGEFSTEIVVPLNPREVEVDHG